MAPSPANDPTPDSAPPPSDATETIASDDSTNPAVPDVPGVLDWVLGGLVLLGGLLFTLGGIVLFIVPDRARIEEVVAADDFQIEGMTEPEFVELVTTLLPWLAAGLMLTGLAMTVLGVAYVVHRRRVRERAAAGEPTSNFPAHALLGAVVSALTSFIPLSPLIGGGLAGYLERGDSERTISVGAASAVVMSAPAIVVGLFVAAGLAAGFATIGDGGTGSMVAVLVIVGGLVSLGITAGLGAAGGWLGGKLAE